MQRRLELPPPVFAVADVDQEAEQHGRHVLQHDALWHDGAVGERGDPPLDHEKRQHEDPDQLPERVTRVALDHLWLARNWTRASSCMAFIIDPKVFGMMPAIFS